MSRHLLPGLLLLLMLAAPLRAAEARVYQWVDPVSGHTQLSGSPPAWYRSTRPGPRVFVIEQGRLIDDTAVAVTEERRRMLRRQAFSAARKQEQQQSRSQELARLRSALQKRRIDLETAREELARLTREKEVAPTSAPAQEQAGESSAAAAGTAAAPPPADDEQTIARLKALIAAWERRRTEQAREALEGGETGGANGEEAAADGRTDAPEPPPSP